MRREFLQLAHTYKPEKPPRKGYDFSGWYWSEKLDGQRCFWDGGITRDMTTWEVPWASVCDPKKRIGKELSRVRKKKVRPLATGLWSRYGNPIQAPDWFLNGLPCMPLDGELFAGRGNFQKTMSIVRKDHAIDEEWKGVQYAVYGCPPLESVFRTGEIKNSNFHCDIDCDEILEWLLSNCHTPDELVRTTKIATFQDELNLLATSLEANTDFAYLHKQTKLPTTHDDAVLELEKAMIKVLDLGGEGIIIRDSSATWQPKRMSHILKYKPFDDDEGTVAGFTSGRETDRGSKFLGLIGALILDFKGKRLELAGLNNEERLFDTSIMADHATKHPGQDMPTPFRGKHFRVGDKVTFKYRELTDGGLPKDARYWRQRDEH